MIARMGNSARPLLLIGAVGLLALTAAAALQQQPVIAIAIPAVLIVTVLCARWPVAALFAMLLLAGGNASVQAFTSVSGGPVVDLLVAGLLVGVLLSLAIDGRDRPLWIWLGVGLIAAYVVVTFLEILTASSIALGLRSFHTSAWFLMMVVLLAVAGWRLKTYERITKAYVGATLAISTYAVFRLIVGPAPEEAAFAAGSSGFYNTIDGEMALIGSFSSRHQLAFWVTCSAPFCFAAALAWQGAWRAVAAAATVLCVIAMFATGVRAAVPGLVVGALIVIALLALSGSRRGAGFARSSGAALAAIVVGAVAFALVVGGGTSASRYEAIVSPSGDASYEQRVGKWTEALRDVDDHPFGQGIGTAGVLQETHQGPYLNLASYGLESTYLKVAYEQGLIVLALFVAMLLTLLAELCRLAIRSRGSIAGGLAIGAAGSLTAGLVMFINGQYIEGTTALALWIPVGTGVGALVSERLSERREGHRAPSAPVPPVMPTVQPQPQPQAMAGAPNS